MNYLMKCTKCQTHFSININISRNAGDSRSRVLKADCTHCYNRDCIPVSGQSLKHGPANS